MSWPRHSFDLEGRQPDLLHSRSRWGLLQVSDVNNPQVAVIRCDKVNSVRDLTQLAVKFNTEVGPDGGFPVLEKVVGGLRLRGVLALNDLEHLLGSSLHNFSP